LFQPPGEVEAVSYAKRTYYIPNGLPAKQAYGKPGNSEFFHNIGDAFLHGLKILPVAEFCKPIFQHIGIAPQARADHAKMRSGRF